MTLKEKLNQDMITAMKEKDKSRLSIIRMVKSDIKNAEIKEKKELNDEEVISVIQRVTKQTNESLEAFEKVNTNLEKIAELKYYLEILASYLPQQLSEAEIKVIVEKVLSENGLTSKKEMGKVMSTLMPFVKGRADGRLVNKVVSEYLI
jgi:uncharacterized protein